VHKKDSIEKACFRENCPFQKEWNRVFLVTWTSLVFN